MPPKDSTDSPDDIPHVRKEKRPDFSKPPARPEKLNKDLQRILSEDSLFDEIYEGTESFRPVAHPWIVKGAYGISWAYLTGDVLNEGYKAYWRNQRMLNPTFTSEQNGLVPKLLPNNKSDESSTAEGTIVRQGRIPAIEDYRTIMAERAVFQSIASMGLPAFTIHSIVKYSGRAFKDAKRTAIRTYMPIGLGLAAVPFLPFIFDKPVEEAVEWTFYHAFKAIGGPQAVGNRPRSGRGHQLDAEARLAYQKEKEKEL
ncbi:MAG: hypothetical protein M1816_000043 [Peltula sp. TS41687]|nr:MAG: hypothetical protein M1816_000043 [Peltula sp. TS41687]